MKKLFYGGDIITMEDKNSKGADAEALLIEDGKILALGARSDLKAQLSDSDEEIDLQGRTLIPSFIDPHSHFIQFANMLKVIPLAGVKSIAEIKEKLIAYKKEKNLKDGDFLMGYGYDQNNLEEKRHPNKNDLDEISVTNPIIVAHISFHMGSLNSRGLEYFKYFKDTPDPEGGTIEKGADGEPTGYVEETAFMLVPGLKVKELSDLDDYFVQAQNIYAGYGITTVQEGLATKTEMDWYKKFAKEGKIKLDCIAYVDIANFPEELQQHRDYLEYHNRFKIGGYKIFLDGSPQGKTAWMSRPYENSGDYVGYPVYTNEQVAEYARQSVDEGVQFLAHANGDQASEQLIESFEKLDGRIDEVRALRPTMIHCQTLRKDQMPRMKKLGMIASIFIAHVYQWGEIHRVNFGEERGSNVSPARSAIDAGLSVNFHQDSPVLPPDMIKTIWTAVNRITIDGNVLGPHQKITPYEALEAVTINGAYAYFEEDIKGSLKAGKLADLVVLDKNPLKIDHAELKDIKVLETYKEGERIFKL